MTGGQTRHGKIYAGAPHGIAEVSAGNVADGIEVTVDEQDWLVKTSAVRRGAGVRDVGSVMQVPGIPRTESSRLKGLH